LKEYPWLRPTKNQTELLVYIRPNSSRTEVTGVFGNPERLKIKIKALPQDGEANKEVVEFVSKIFKVSKSRVGILRGEISQQKDLLIDLPYEKAIILVREIF